MLKKMSFLSSIISTVKSFKNTVKNGLKKKKNLYFLVPLFSLILCLALPPEIKNEYFYGGNIGVITAAMLYRYRWIAEFMHRKPTYIETATIFKTQTGEKNTKTLDEQLVHEIDHILTKRFRSVFIHGIIFIDSVCVGILGYWAYIHTEGRDPNHWVNNLGFIGGYLMFFKQVHYYSGKFVLWSLLRRKKAAHDAEFRRRRSNSSEFTESPIISAIKSYGNCTIPVVRSFDNFSLCGHELPLEATAKLDEIPPFLDLNSDTDSEGKVVTV